MNVKINAVTATLILFSLISCGNDSGNYADLIIEGKIFTCETDSSYASALAVKNGKIIALDEDALSQRGENTAVIQADGLVLPGFVDCHSHGASGLRLAQLYKAYGDSLLNGKNPFEGKETTDAAMRGIILSYQKLMAANGITSFCDACTNLDNFDLTSLYEQMDNEGKIFIHTFGMYKITPETISEIDSISSLSTAYKGGNFELNSLKIYLDRQSFLPEDADNFTLQDLIPTRKLSKLISAANTGRLSVCAHAFNATAVKNFAEYSSLKSSENSRNSLVHIQSADENSIDAVYSARLTAIVNPFLFAKDTVLTDSAFFARYRDTPDLIYPVKDLIDKNIHVAIGMDYPSSQSLSFLDAIYHLVARKHYGMPDSSALSPDQGISAARAVRCATYEGAYALGKENAYGSVTIGKAADLVILDKDITNCPTEEIPDAKVIYTVVNGKVVFHRSDPVR